MRSMQRERVWCEHHLHAVYASLQDPTLALASPHPNHRIASYLMYACAAGHVVAAERDQAHDERSSLQCFGVV